MGLLNIKCIGILVLCVMGTWTFPFGAMLAAGLIAAWLMLKRRKGLAIGKTPKPAAPQGGGNDDAFKLLVMSMLADKVAAGGDAVASQLGVPVTTAKASAPKKPAIIKDAEYALKASLLE
nr:hypothetical protein [Candidatus Sigynarchaeota archaeon]